MRRRDYDLRADDFTEPTFTGDPASCLCSTDVVGSNTFCSLCNAWCNCMKRGCFITSDGRPTQRAVWYALLQAICRDHDIETEMHTSATTLYSYMLDRRIVSLLTKFDRLVYHCKTIDDLLRVDSTFALRYRYFMTPIRAVFVVTPGTNATLVDAIERTFHNCPSIGELTFRQMVDGNFVPDGTLRDHLLEGHREGRWHYTEQDDYNRYIVNDKVYDRFEDIALAYSR